MKYFKASLSRANYDARILRLFNRISSKRWNSTIPVWRCIEVIFILNELGVVCTTVHNVPINVSLEKVSSSYLKNTSASLMPEIVLFERNLFS